MEGERAPWWVWIPALPKPIIVAAWVVFCALSACAPFIRHLVAPGQAWWLDIWHGVGGNAIGVFSWMVIAAQLTSAVVCMIFTFRANKRQVEEASIKSREKGREEGREEMRQEWQDWLNQIKDESPENWPPPPGSSNGDRSGYTG